MFEVEVTYTRTVKKIVTGENLYDIAKIANEQCPKGYVVENFYIFPPSPEVYEYDHYLIQ